MNEDQLLLLSQRIRDERDNRKSQKAAEVKRSLMVGSLVTIDSNGLRVPSKLSWTLNSEGVVVDINRTRAVVEFKRERDIIGSRITVPIQNLINTGRMADKIPAPEPFLPRLR